MGRPVTSAPGVHGPRDRGGCRREQGWPPLPRGGREGRRTIRSARPIAAKKGSLDAEALASHHEPAHGSAAGIRARWAGRADGAGAQAGQEVRQGRRRPPERCRAHGGPRVAQEGSAGRRDAQDPASARPGVRRRERGAATARAAAYARRGDDAYPDKPLYEPTVLRTLFLDFEDKDWEAEMADFYRTDVEVPATLTVDGRRLPGVGVHFRGLSSYFSVREGRKRSLNLSLDFVDPDQRLDGYKTLNLLNSHEDPSFLHTVLYLRDRPALHPRAQGELRPSGHQRRELGPVCQRAAVRQEIPRRELRDQPGGPLEGAREPGRRRRPRIPRRGRRRSTRSGSRSSRRDNKADWKALIALCKTLNQTPTEQLEEALKPVLDIDGVLWFLALDNVLVNSDGYWTRASDYSIYRDPKGEVPRHPPRHERDLSARDDVRPRTGLRSTRRRPSAGPGAVTRGARPGAGPGMGRGPGPGGPPHGRS